MRRFVCLLVFLALVGEVPGTLYMGKWDSPLSIIGTLLLAPLVKFPLLYIIALGITFLNRSQLAPRHCARPVTQFIRVSLLATVCLWVWGVVTGGNAYQTIWQLHGFVMLFGFAGMVLTTMRTPKDFFALGQSLVAAAMVRATMAFIFRFFVMQSLHIELGDVGSGFCVTTHSDTALFVTGIVLVAAWALEAPSRRSIGVAIVVFGYLAAAIQVNNRRLAWVSLIASLAILYAFLPKGRIRRALNRTGLLLAPVLAAYIAIGWGHTDGIWKPVGSLSTMFGKKEDASSETRNIENYNLIQTMKQNPLVGTGWGHEYNEVSVAYSIKEAFPQYRYIPHNSVLGLLAFTGLFGFAGTWMILPVVVYLATRTLRATKDPITRAAALAAIAEVAIYTNQGYGDMGLSATTCTVIMACGFAVAGRLSVLSGGWTTTGKPAGDEAAAA